MKFLFALWDGGGAVPPELGVAQRLIDRDHDVRVIADPTLRDQVVAIGAGFTPWDAAPHRTTGDATEDLVKDLRSNVIPFTLTCSFSKGRRVT